MRSKDFLAKKLNELVSIFIELKVRYEYDQKSQTHKVEINPIEIFEDNEDYLFKEFEIENEFEKNFPEENIIFISKKSLTQINEPELEFGYNISVGDHSFINFQNDFSKLAKSISDLLNISFNNYLVNSFNLQSEHLNYFEDCLDFEIKIKDSFQTQDNSDNSIIKENNYALAA